MKSVVRIVLLICIISICFQSIVVGASAETTISPTLRLGDADGDGEITITDCTRIQRDIAQIAYIPDVLKPTADIDGDGLICILDATLIQKWLVNMEVGYQIGCLLRNKSEESTVSNTPSAPSVTESAPAPTIAPTTQPNVQTVKPTESLPDPNAKQVCVSGVTFDVSKIKASYNLTDSNCSKGVTLILIPKSDVNPADITTVINNGNTRYVIDYSNPVFKESYIMGKSSDVLLGYDCQVVDRSGAPLAYAYAHYCGDKYYKYQTSIYGFEKASGSFPVEFYYKGQLIKRCTINVNISTTDTGLQSIMNTTRDIENKCWTSGMTDRQKMDAFAQYIKSHFSYANLKCVEGAMYTAYAARDLGLVSMLLYPGGEENQHCDYHIVTYNLYQNTYSPGGHCACLIDYGDSVIRYDVQGGACVISNYSFG